MIVGWYNPLLKRNVPLGDPSLEAVMPSHVLRYIKQKEEKDKRHTGLNLSATTGTGCPKAFLINRMLPTHPDPQKLWPPTGGTMMHKELGEALGNGVWYSEENHPEKCTFAGKLFGQDMSCLIDLRREDFSKIWDYKFSFSGADKFIDKERVASPLHTAQLSICCELIEQQEGIKLPDDIELVAWVVGKSWQKTFVERKGHEEILNTVVGWTKMGGKWRYKDMFNEVVEAKERIEEMEKEYGVGKVPDRKIEDIIAKMPYYGEDMWKGRAGSWCMNGCAVAKQCFGIGGGI